MAEFVYGNIICENIEGHAGPAMYVGRCGHEGIDYWSEDAADILWLHAKRLACIDIRPWELCTHLVDEEGNLPNDETGVSTIDMTGTKVVIGGVDVTDRVKIKDSYIIFDEPITIENGTAISIEYTET